MCCVVLCLLATHIEAAWADCCVVTEEDWYDYEGTNWIAFPFSIGCDEIINCLGDNCYELFPGCSPDWKSVSGWAKVGAISQNAYVYVVIRHYEPEPAGGCPGNQMSVDYGESSGLPWTEIVFNESCSTPVIAYYLDSNDLSSCLYCMVCPQLTVEQRLLLILTCISYSIESAFDSGGYYEWKSGDMGNCDYP